MLPVVADATVKGSKYIVKALKEAAVNEIFELSSEALASLSRISGQLKAADGTICEDCVNAITRLLAENAGKENIIEGIVKKAKDAGLS